MGRFLLRKAPSVLMVLIAASIIAFSLPRLAPGDPATAAAGPDASAAQVEAIRQQLGLDEPVVTQYWDWIRGVFTGNLGQSYIYNRPVSEVISARVGSTLELAALAAIIMIIVGLSLGTLAGSNRSRWARGMLDGTNTILLAVPPFVTGLLLILIFGIAFRLLPVSGEVSLISDPAIGIQYLILPAIALALPQAAVIARLVQSSMLQARSEDFVDLATAKGVAPRRITVRHVLRNSVGTAVVAIGLRLGELLGGAIVIEAIFARNGLGALAVSSVQNRDYLVLQTLILGAVFIAVAIQLLTEIVLAGLDPRVRLGA